MEKPLAIKKKICYTNTVISYITISNQSYIERNEEKKDEKKQSLVSKTLGFVDDLCDAFQL